MRLGQLARKVNVKPAQIISFLEKEHDITVEENLNSKIEEKSLELVLAEFKVEEVLEESKIEMDKTVSDENSENETALPIIAEEIEEDITSDISQEVEPVGELKEDDIVLVESTEGNTVTDEPEKLIAVDEDGEEIELHVVDGIIKAPKKELEGFKVVGKIELPKKKKPVTFIITNGGNSTDITDEILEKREELARHKKEQYLARKKKRQTKANERKGGKRKVLTELELKEKANKLAVEKQIQNTKVDKNLKKKHYQENIQPKSTSHKKKKKKSSTKTDGIKTVKGYEKEPTTRLGRIWKWFNT